MTSSGILLCCHLVRLRARARLPRAHTECPTRCCTATAKGRGGGLLAKGAPGSTSKGRARTRGRAIASLLLPKRPAGRGRAERTRRGGRGSAAEGAGRLRAWRRAKSGR